MKKVTLFSFVILANIFILPASVFGENQEGSFAYIGDYTFEIPKFRLDNYTVAFDNSTNPLETSYSEQEYNESDMLVFEKKDNLPYTFEYNDAGRLVSVTEQYNTQTFTGNLTYNDNGYITSISNPLINDTKNLEPHELTYEFNSNGYVIGVYNEGDYTSYDYYDSGLIKTGKDNKWESIYKYDMQGNIISIESTPLDPTSKEQHHTFSFTPYDSYTYSSKTSEDLNSSDLWYSYPEYKQIPALESCINTVTLKNHEIIENTEKYIYSVNRESYCRIKTINNIYGFQFVLGSLPMRIEEGDMTLYKYAHILSDVCNMDISTNGDGFIYINENGKPIGTLCMKFNVTDGYYIELILGDVINSGMSESVLENPDSNNSTPGLLTENEPINESYDNNQMTTTSGQRNALRKAQQYLDYTAFSYSGLIEQLEYEGFSYDEAVYGADNCGADWYEQAVKKAQQYLDYTAFSYDGLVEQLEYEGFSYDEATYGASQAY